MSDASPLSRHAIDAQYDCRPEAFECVRGTKLVYLDEDAARRDFGATPAAASQASRDEIGAFLKDVGSVMSAAQCQPNEVHDSVPTRGSRRVGYRPPRFGRAALFQFSEARIASIPPGFADGLLDIKGCGIQAGRTPMLGEDRTGVLFLHEAVTELLTKRLLDRVFQLEGVGVRTLDYYALVHLGVYATVSWCRPLPCCTLARSVVTRPKENVELPKSGSVEERVQHEIEHLLLSNGLSSVGAINTLTMCFEDGRHVARLNGRTVEALSEDIIYEFLETQGLAPPQIFHGTNVQIARDCSAIPLRATLTDLGHYRGLPDPPGHIVTFVSDRALNWGMMTKKTGAQRPRGRAPVRQDVVGVRLLSDEALPKSLMSWLQPTGRMKPAVSGIVGEALRLTAAIDQGNLDLDALSAALDAFVDRAMA